jgi:uncharacterized protein DUF4331
VKNLKSMLAVCVSAFLAAPPAAFPASHREAPITSLDHPADITDVYAFVSYDHPDRVTLIMDVDPFLEPSNGPNYFPFDPDVLYVIHIDNNRDAAEDVTFEFRFKTEIRAAGLFTGFVGAGTGIAAPANAPNASAGGAAAGQAVIPPAITALDGDGSAGLSLRQSYTVTMVRGTGDAAVRTDLSGSQKLFTVPSNVGPRTMPNYTALAQQGIYPLTARSGVTVFAGTVDDPFFIDVGAAFDSLNLRSQAFRSGITGVMTPFEDLNDQVNSAADSLSGFNVNTIAIEVPISLVTQPGQPVIGVWATTSRQQMTVRRVADTAQNSGPFVQIQRMANPLINELLIGTADKDKWSQSEPKDDSQFAKYALDPLLARVLNAVFSIPVPSPPRNDLLPLVQYSDPNNKGPIADLLRLDTSVKATGADTRSRLGVLGGDPAGFPNGRRVFDDVTDIALRVVAGALAGNPFNLNRLGDGVNTNDVPYQETFPYVAFAQSGRNRRHIDPGEPGCLPGFSVSNLLQAQPCPVQ